MTIPNLLQRVKRHRRGVAALLFAFLLPMFVGFMTLSVDSSVIATARAQLSTAADAAALAGAMQLANEYRVRGSTNLTSTISAANQAAVSFAASNNVLGQPVAVVANTSNTAGGDVVIGYLNPNNTTGTLDSSAAMTSLFNSVQVTAARSPTRTGVVPTFFASLLGFSGTTVSVTSTALAWNYSISGFQSTGSLRAGMLPIVLDQTTYNAMIAGTTTDQYTYNPTTGTVVSGADGITESLLYPVSAGLPGNWGTIKVGVNNNSTAVLNDQILNGISPAQLATFPGGVIQLDQTLTPPSITFSGNPGISAGIKSSLESIIGEPVTIPIYDQSGGNGSNAWYRVIQFAAVRILSVNFQGNPKYVIVQPALVNDATAIRGSAQSSWSAGGMIVLHLAK